MDATAKLSAKVEKPVYHASINWHPDEAPTPAEMKVIARRALKLMELEQHQALVMGHGDTAHPHLHMMINRINPETGKAWRTGHDYQRFDRVMKLLADEHGFDYVPSYRFNPNDDGKAAARRPRQTPFKKDRREREGTLPAMSQERSRELQRQLDEAQSWEDVAVAVALQGYELEAKGQGLIARWEGAYAKFSSLGGSMRALESKFGEEFAAYRRRGPVLVDGIDILRALARMGMADREDVADAIQDFKREREEKGCEPLSRQVAQAIRQWGRDQER